MRANLNPDDRFQPEYERSTKYLDVAARINLLNTRLNVLKDMQQILMDAAHNAHGENILFKSGFFNQFIAIFRFFDVISSERHDKNAVNIFHYSLTVFCVTVLLFTASVLEWIIIWLIVVEILIEVMRGWRDFF